MAYRVVWTDPALEEFRELIRYVKSHNRAAADKLGRQITSHVRLLRTLPFMGPVFPCSSRIPVRHTVCRTCRIFYRVRRDQQIVEILTLRHTSQDDPDFVDE